MNAPATGPPVEFRALGAPRLSRSGNELQSILTRPKLLGLLSFVALSPPGFHRRDTLLGLFWAETDQARARRALRQSLYYLRQSLGPDTLVSRGEDELGLDESLLWSDVRAFETALGEGRGEEALELYNGDLLAGFFVAGAPEYERWLDERRETLRRKASAAAWALAGAAEADGNAAGTGHWARRATALEPFDENLAGQAIELLDRVGDRSGALQLYESFSRRLAQEFEVEPAPETQALVARIRGRVAAPAAETVPEAAGPAADAPGSPAERLPETDAATGGPVQPEPPPPPRSWRPGRRSLAAGVVLGAAIGIALFRLLGTGGDPAMDPGRVFVAVFDNQTGNSDLDPLGRMAADWITQALHESGVVEVVPGTIGLAPRADFTDGQRVDAADLARSTGAGTIITGAYYLSGDSLEIQAQFIDAGDGRLLGALPPAASPLDALGTAVDSLSQRAVRTLAVLVDPSLATSADLSRPPSLEAYRQYLEGLRNFRRVPLRMSEALLHFHRALALDSAFLAPRFYVIMTHANLGEFALADSNAQILETQRVRLSESQRHTLDWMVAWLRGDQMGALEAARAKGGIDAGPQALAVNRPAEAIEVLTAEDVSPHFFQWLALMEAWHILGNYDRELSEARRGRALYPGRLRMVDTELRALAALGRTSEVERILDEVTLLPAEEPITPATVMLNTAAELRAHGHRKPSIEVADRAAAWWRARPGAEMASWSSRYELALARYGAERWEDAASLFRELDAEHPEHLAVRGFLGALAARRGDRTEALAISADLEARAVPLQFGGDSYRKARIAALLGDRENAVALLRDAVAQGFAFGIWMHRDADLEPLRGYPPFEEFMRPKG